MKNVKYIVVQCTATPPNATVREVKKNWRKREAYAILKAHPYLIKRNGEIERLWYYTVKEASGRDGGTPVDECLHIAYIGGIDREGKPADNKTQRQEDALFDKLVELSEKYPDAKIVGYDDLTGIKNSPCFNVKEWLANYKPDFLELEYETEQAA